MTDKNAGLASVPEVKPKPLASIAVDATKSTKKVRARAGTTHETTLQALKRIFGDVVLDLFPEDVQDAVEAAYKFWSEHSDSYLVTPFETEQDKNDAVAVMRAFAEVAPKGPYTIRVDKDSEPHILHWRAQTRSGQQAAAE